MAGLLPIRVLVVEPDVRLREQLRLAGRAMAAIMDFPETLPSARVQLGAQRYDWLVTNIRLGEYNGLHLALLAAMAAIPPRTLVYGERDDLPLGREAQRMGAFFEVRGDLARALPGYLLGDMPPSDRRDPGLRDRRVVFRGGRRRYDFLTS
jgi:hypothetical protein